MECNSSADCTDSSTTSANRDYPRYPRPYIQDAGFFSAIGINTRRLVFARRMDPRERIWGLWIGLGRGFVTAILVGISGGEPSRGGPAEELVTLYGITANAVQE